VKDLHFESHPDVHAIRSYQSCWLWRSYHHAYCWYIIFEEQIRWLHSFIQFLRLAIKLVVPVTSKKFDPNNAEEREGLRRWRGINLKDSDANPGKKSIKILKTRRDLVRENRINEWPAFSCRRFKDFMPCLRM
jgi:hypothetical protein